MNRADFGSTICINLFVQLIGNYVSKFSTNFLKCVGDTTFRGRFRVEIHEI